MSKDCHVDVETFSKVLLKTAGTYRYAQHKSTDIMCLVFAFGDEDPNLWIPRKIPKDLLLQIRRWMGENHPRGQVHIGRTCPMRIKHH